MHHTARIIALLHDQGRDDYQSGHPITYFDKIVWIAHTKSKRAAYNAGWQAEKNEQRRQEND